MEFFYNVKYGSSISTSNVCQINLKRLQKLCPKKFIDILILSRKHLFEIYIRLLRRNNKLKITIFWQTFDLIIDIVKGLRNNLLKIVPTFVRTFFRIKTFSICLKKNFMKPHKISTHSACPDNSYFYFFYRLSDQSWNLVWMPNMKIQILNWLYLSCFSDSDWFEEEFRRSDSDPMVVI